MAFYVLDSVTDVMSMRVLLSINLSFSTASGSLPPGHVGIRILAGITTGGMSVVFAQPTDVVKVRMQAQVTGLAPRYVGTIGAYRTIAVEEGMKGLWKGKCWFLK